MSELFGLPVANASMYDGASAAAEAVLMARRLTGREQVLVSAGVHPHYLDDDRDVLAGHRLGQGCDRHGAARRRRRGRTSARSRSCDHRRARPCVVDRLPELLRLRHRRAATPPRSRTAKGALLVTATTEPYALALLESPGALGADIAVGEGQPLGLPPQYGGPYAGLFACRDEREFLQQIPGRLVRRDGRQERRARLRAHALDARAAHPPRARDQQHLHEHAASARSR